MSSDAWCLCIQSFSFTRRATLLSARQGMMSARGDFLNYALSLMRSHNDEHSDVLPVLDVCSLKHVAYVFQALIYWIKAMNQQTTLDTPQLERKRYWGWLPETELKQKWHKPFCFSHWHCSSITSRNTWINLYVCVGMCSNIHIIKRISIMVCNAPVFDKPVAVHSSLLFMLIAVKCFLTVENWVGFLTR